MAYISNLPLWGTAENDGEGIKANVYFLTSIIKVYLTNALHNASQVRITAFDDIEGNDPAYISGFSTVQVSENNQPLSASEVQLANPTSGNLVDATLSNQITVNLGDLNGKATNSVIYIPLIAGYYGKVDVEYYDLAEGAWKTIRTYLDKEFKRGTPYGNGNKKEFEADVTSISGLNNMLANLATSASGEVEVGVQNPITAFDAEQLTVPAMSNVTKLTLNIPGFTPDPNTTPLTVGGDFAGTLVLNPEAAAMGVLNIQTTKANVVIGGVWGNSAFNIKYAKNVQFGGLLNDEEEEIGVDYGPDAPGTNNTITLGAAVEGVIVSEKAKVGAITLDTNHKAATLNVLGTAGNITVAASELQKATAVKVAGTAGAIAINGDANEATVELTGTATSITNNGKGAITISGNPVYQATGAKKVGAVATKGDVTINLANEGVAIRGGLTFNAPATFTLTQGYVDAITVNAGENKTVTCTLGNGYVTLPKPTLNDGSKFTVSNVPAWNGEKIGGSFNSEAEVNAIKALVGEANYHEPEDWGAFKDAFDAVYTPIGLAENAGKFTLKNDIDLNNKAWTPAATTGDINGGGKTIKKLTVAVPANNADADAATNGLGLFTELGHKVENLTIDGVTIAAKEFTTGGNKYQVKNIGALAGKLTAEKEIKYVTIKNINLSSSNGGGVIGGVIGTNTAAATLTGVVVSGTNAIEGYGDLGGLIGYAAGNVTIKKCAKNAIATNVPAADVASAATVSFSTAYNNTEVTNDLKYLQVGNFIGSADKTKAIVITDAADAKPTLTYDKSAYTGTTKYQVSVAGTTKSYDIVFDKQTLIGWCGDAAFTADPQINGKSYPVYDTKPDVSTIAPANQYWLYYIDRE